MICEISLRSSRGTTKRICSFDFSSFRRNGTIFLPWDRTLSLVRARTTHPVTLKFCPLHKIGWKNKFSAHRHFDFQLILGKFPFKVEKVNSRSTDAKSETRCYIFWKHIPSAKKWCKVCFHTFFSSCAIVQNVGAGLRKKNNLAQGRKNTSRKNTPRKKIESAIPIGWF